MLPKAQPNTIKVNNNNNNKNANNNPAKLKVNTNNNESKNQMIDSGIPVQVIKPNNNAANRQFQALPTQETRSTTIQQVVPVEYEPVESPIQNPQIEQDRRNLECRKILKQIGKCLMEFLRIYLAASYGLCAVQMSCQLYFSLGTYRNFCQNIKKSYNTIRPKFEPITEEEKSRYSGQQFFACLMTYFCLPTLLTIAQLEAVFQTFWIVIAIGHSGLLSCYHHYNPCRGNHPQRFTEATSSICSRKYMFYNCEGEKVVIEDLWKEDTQFC